MSNKLGVEHQPGTVFWDGCFCWFEQKAFGIEGTPCTFDQGIDRWMYRLDQRGPPSLEIPI